MDLFAQIPQHLKYIITGIGAILAIIGLFVDKSSQHFKYIAPFFVVLILVLGVVQAVDTLNSNQESDEAKQKTDTLLVLVNNSAKSSLKTSSYLTDILLSQPKILKDFGMTVERVGKPLDQVTTAELVTGEILKANKYRLELISERPPSLRLSTEIWYYNKEMDSSEIRSVLNEIGFKVINKVAKSHQKNDRTNAVWYGQKVNLNDYKALLVSLLRAGIDIKRTGPSCENQNLKKNVIEVGASDDAAGFIDGIVKPTKSIQEIKSATTLEELSDIKC
jgi:hypothetical protein